MRQTKYLKNISHTISSKNEKLNKSLRDPDSLSIVNNKLTQSFEIYNENDANTNSAKKMKHNL